jgi:hypothetical protein
MKMNEETRCKGARKEGDPKHIASSSKPSLQMGRLLAKGSESHNQIGTLNSLGALLRKG